MKHNRIAELETLDALAITGSFSEAARRLGISQSSVSRRISNLEARLENRSLVARTTRDVQLTETGRVYLSMAKAGLDQIEAAEQHVLARDGELHGTIRISLPPAIGRAALLPAFDTLLDTYPRLNLEVDFSERYVDFFQDQIDLAVRIRRTRQSGIEEVQLGQTNIVLAASRDYVAKLGALTHPKLDHPKLDTARVIAPRQQHSKDFDRVARKLGIGDHQTRVFVDDMAAVEQLVRRGTGIAFLPEIIVRDGLKNGSVVALNDVADQPRVRLYGTYPYAFRASRRLAAVLASLREAISASETGA